MLRFTDAERYFVSEASVYRLLKAYDLITSPAFITMTAGSQQALPLLKVERLRRGMAAEQPQVN
jgi:hypothetical protein